MDGEGGAFLFLLGNFSQDSYDFSQRWEKMSFFYWEKGNDFLFFFTFGSFPFFSYFFPRNARFFPNTWVFRGSCGKSIVLPCFPQYFCSVEETRQR